MTGLASFNAEAKHSVLLGNLGIESTDVICPETQRWIERTSSVLGGVIYYIVYIMLNLFFASRPYTQII